MIRPYLKALLLPALALLAGCGSTNIPSPMQEVPMPWRGGTMDPAVLEVEKPEGQQDDLYGSKVAMWGLPFSIYTKSVGITDTEVRNVRFAYNDLLIPGILFALPTRLSYSEAVYTKPSLEPTSESHVRINPIYAWSKETGNGETTKFRALGVPLIFMDAALYEETTDTDVAVFSSLWSLGPAGVKFRTGKGRSEGWGAAPLLLGGLPGIVLWSHWELKLFGNGEPESARASMHGPLFGLLGYRKVNVPLGGDNAGPITGRMLYSDVLLGGLLWKSSEQMDGEGKNVRGAKGVLYSAFGQGQKEGRKMPRIFWINVPI